MTIRCLVFGPLRDLLPQHTREVDAPCTIAQFREALCNEYPALRERRFTVARNHAIAADDEQLSDQDEVALLPPFSGG